MSSEKESKKCFGPYQVIRKLGHGGMGEVYLAFDTICQRKIALKRIREELVSQGTIRERFLREATLTAQLIHPAIIPIYTIHEEGKELYYIMPYLEGDTLKQVIIETRMREKEGRPPHPIGSSITTLARTFLSICQAISYCHSRNILHRDLKPENVMIGSFGQVVILDWGLAARIGAHENEGSDLPEIKETKEQQDLTRPGKVHGTLSHLAPERIYGAPSSCQTDIYSLGVILYQMLTLHPPFHRGRFREAKRLLPFERLVDPAELAPHRAIPVQLSEITKKALAPSVKDRYATVDEMIADLENFIEGKPDWIFKQALNPSDETPWEFQENVLLSKFSRVSRSMGMMEWGMLMISKEKSSSHLKLECEVSLSEDAEPFSILLAIPEPTEQKALESGFRITFGSPREAGLRLTRDGVEVAYSEGFALKIGVMQTLTIERIDESLVVYVDRKPIVEYTTLIPVQGAHVGLILRPGSFKLSPLRLYEGSHCAKIGCLTIPDNYLISGDFTRAITEYRRIAESFKGREEGYLALFRLGMGYIEAARLKESSGEYRKLLAQAMDAFEDLSETQGAPLSWLGKSILYALDEEYEDEIRCLELAIRKYPKHPLLLHVEDRIFFRLYETCQKERLLAYEFALLALRLSKGLSKRPEAQRTIRLLVDDLEWPEWLEELEDGEEEPNSPNHRIDEITLIAFWLQKPRVLLELLDQTALQSPSESRRIQNILYSLLVMRQMQSARERLSKIFEAGHVVTEEGRSSFEKLQIAAMYDESSLALLLEQVMEGLPTKKLTQSDARPLLFLLTCAIIERQSHEITPFLADLEAIALSNKLPSLISRIALLWMVEGEMEKAEKLLEHDKEESYTSILFELLSDKEQEKLSLLRKQWSDSRFPKLQRLFVGYLLGKIDLREGWALEAFWFEKVTLLAHIALYYHLSGKWGKAVIFDRKLRKLFDSLTEA